MKVTTIVDKLGKLKAEIAELEAKEAKLRQELIDAGIDEADGKLFRATVSHLQVSVVDYRGIVKELKVPVKVLKAHTEVRESVRVKISSR